jgi:hypothetical protein
MDPGSNPGEPRGRNRLKMNAGFESGPIWKRPLLAALASFGVWLVYRAALSWPLGVSDFLLAGFIAVAIFVGTILIDIWMKRQM